MAEPSKIISTLGTALHWRRRFIIFVLLLSIAPILMRSIFGEQMGGLAAFALIAYVFRSELKMLWQLIQSVQGKQGEEPGAAVAKILKPLVDEVARKKAARPQPTTTPTYSLSKYDPLGTTASPTAAPKADAFLSRGARQPLPMPQSKDALFWRKPR